MLRSVLTGGAALLVGAAVALPLHADDAAPSLFSQLDVNNDGRLTADEVSDQQKRFFERLLRVGDKDDDGVLTRDEYVAATSEQDRPVTAGSPERRRGVDPEVMFRQLDRDGDRTLTLAEIPERMQDRIRPLFERLDKDQLSYEEFTAAMQQRQRPGAGNSPGGRMQFLKRLDRNGDGKLSQDEIPEQARERLQPLFDRLGTDEIDLSRLENLPAGNRPGRQRPEQDGKSRPERDGQTGNERPRPVGRPEGRPALLRAIDSNGDGRISREELTSAASQFDRLDRNGDGLLDPQELSGGSNRPGNRSTTDRRRPAADAPTRPRRPGGSDAPRGGAGMPDRSAMFNQLDRDGDGFISKSEAPQRLSAERFDQLDTNGDGKLSRREAAAMRQRRGRPGPGGNRRVRPGNASPQR